MDKKPMGILAIGVGPKLKSKDSDMGDEHEDERSDMAMSAMSDFIDAVHAKDTAAAMAAYTDLCELHKDSGSEDYDA